MVPVSFHASESARICPSEPVALGSATVAVLAILQKGDKDEKDVKSAREWVNPAGTRPRVFMPETTDRGSDQLGDQSIGDLVKQLSEQTATLVRRRSPSPASPR